MTKYSFSGHESFPCKTLWLKKGYDYVRLGGDFNSARAVTELGVGKNMVSSIRYWLKAYGLYDGRKTTPMGDYLFDNHKGKDKYIEDIATLQLLHYMLVEREEASLYSMIFLGLQRERTVFDREQASTYVALRLAEAGKQKQFNANTVKKDIAVLLQSYTLPRHSTSNDDYSSLMIDLDLIRQNREDKGYTFNQAGKRAITKEVFLYALLRMQDAKGDRTIPMEEIQDKIGLAFCMTEAETIEMLYTLSERHRGMMTYSDIAGIRQVQFTEVVDPITILDEYYETHN